MITGIVAIARNNAIGRDGRLPWHYSTDLKFFKRTTTGGVVVMGYNTWRSIGRPLPNRRNIVLSRRRELGAESGAELARSKDEIVGIGRSADVFIIGGAEIYREFADVIDRWIVTRIPETVDDADTFFPPELLDGFVETGREPIGDDLIAETYQRVGFVV